MSKLFNILRDVLTPYANKINLHSEEIDGLQENVNNGFANLESEIGVTSPAFEVVTGQYINNIGLERSGSNFDRSEPIPISAYSTVVFSAVGYNQGVAMIATCDENGSNIKAAVISVDSSLHTYTHYTEIDTYIIVSYIKSQSHDLKVYNYKSNDVLNRKISEIETVTINKSFPTYNAEQGKYINSAGQNATSQNFSISSPIKIESNSLILFTAKGYLQSVSMISLCDANGENIVPIIVSINSDVETYSYFADNECYIMLSYYTSAVHELSVQGQTSNVSLAANISTVADDLATAGKDILSGFKNITCIGDSLTYSAVYTSSSSYRQAYKPYPLILKSKTGADVQTIAEPGITSTGWWGKHNGDIIEKSNHLTIIYLGTNSGLTDTMATDMVGNDYTQWADTNTGNYGKIVAKSLECGSRVVLVKCCKSSGDVDITNSVIEQMAERFSVAVVKNPYLSDIKYHYYPNGSGFNSTHYNDFGYSVFASQLIYNISNLPTEILKRILPETQERYVDGIEASIEEIKTALNNSYIGTDFEWEIGTLTPNTGVELVGNTRIRSLFIPVSPGTKLIMTEPTSRLLVYCYDSSKGYVSDSVWLSTNEFTVPYGVGFVRVLLRKSSSNPTIQESEIDSIASDLAIEFPIPHNTYVDAGDFPKIKTSLSGTRYLPVELGTYTGGKPYNSTAYVRSMGFALADIGDVLTVTPNNFNVYNGALYKYSVNNVSGYYGSVTIPTVNAGKKWRYVFTEKCWFCFRMSNASSGANIGLEDLYKFDNIIKLEHIYESSELTEKIYPLAVDYDTLNAGITGKFNIAVQTDTHMSKKPTYTSNAYGASDFDALSAVVSSVNSVEVTLFAHLGDFIRGYQSDPDYESRLTADAMMDVYEDIRTNKAFVIGNHDDGCLFYGNATYNDNKNTSQVMFPNEQFNRYTKYGINNAYASNYYYKDISGIRVITLWQRDFNYAQSIPEIESFNIGQTQLNWLTGTALNTDLPVIIMCHAPLVSTLYSTSRSGFDAVLTAINTFVSGGGTVIAVLSGHTHARGADKVDGINHIVFKNGYDFFELVSVDTTNRTISCKMVGSSGEDRSFTY